MPQGCPCWGWGQGWGGVERQAKTQGEVGYGKQASRQTELWEPPKGAGAKLCEGEKSQPNEL